jgi:hypothetical protein
METSQFVDFDPILITLHVRVETWACGGYNEISSVST